MKVYLSGPITLGGTSLTSLEERKEVFANTARAVAAELECEVVNPMDIGAPDCGDRCNPPARGDNMTGGVYTPGYTDGNPDPEEGEHHWQCWMKHDLKALLDCDTICMMVGWEESRGATLEYQLAQGLDYQVIYVDEKGCTNVP